MAKRVAKEPEPSEEIGNCAHGNPIHYRYPCPECLREGKPTGELEQPVKIGEGKWRARLQLDWLPLPTEAVATLGWTEGTELEIVPIYGDQIVVRRKGALSNGAEVPSKNT